MYLFSPAPRYRNIQACIPRHRSGATEMQFYITPQEVKVWLGFKDREFKLPHHSVYKEVRNYL